MKTINNKRFLVLLSIIAILCMTTSAFFFNINAVKADGVPPITMEMGAGVRIDGGVNGLRFIASMSNEDYGWFAENVGEGKPYASVRFGMLIAPADYLTDYADFTEENLFGANPKYDWAKYVNGEWVYSGNNGAIVNEQKTPVRIINTVTDKMRTYSINNIEKMAVIGAIIDYREYNIVREFVGRGYYQLLDGEGDVVKTEFAGYADSQVANNTRSMIATIQKAIENEELDSTQLASVQETYFDEITDNVSVKNENIDVLLTTTVAGNAYNGEKTSVDIKTVVYTSETGKKTEFELNSWRTESVNLSITNGVVSGINVCGGSLITSQFLNLRLTADVYVPVSTRADMDALGFDYREDQTITRWGTGARYMLTNDIDYATDTSTYGDFRMDDGNGTQDLWDRYLIPIAANYGDYKNTASRSRTGTYEWGIFGQIGADAKFFYGIIDGAGYAIKNAVIPYGTVFAYGDINCNHGQNFIGALVYGAQLRNIAFTGLQFEDPVQIAQAGADNPYYTDANPNNDGTTLKTKGYITGTSIFNVNYGQYLAMNSSNRTGLVGAMQNAVISNVYVEAAIKSGTYGLDAVNGLLVANIDVDYLPDGVNPYMGTYGRVENCITKTSYAVSNVNYFGDAGGAINAGMATIVGKSSLSATAINNCFTVGSLTLVLKDRTTRVACDTIFTPNPDKFASYKASTNCGVYANVNALREAQSEVLANMSIAKYLN